MNMYYAEYEGHPLLIMFEAESENSAIIEIEIWLDDYDQQFASSTLGTLTIETDAETGNSTIVARDYKEEEFGDRLKVWIDTSSGSSSSLNPPVVELPPVISK